MTALTSRSHWDQRDPHHLALGFDDVAGERRSPVMAKLTPRAHKASTARSHGARRAPPRARVPKASTRWGVPLAVTSAGSPMCLRARRRPRAGHQDLRLGEQQRVGAVDRMAL